VPEADPGIGFVVGEGARCPESVASHPWFGEESSDLGDARRVPVVPRTLDAVLGFVIIPVPPSGDLGVVVPQDVLARSEQVITVLNAIATIRLAA